MSFKERLIEITNAKASDGSDSFVGHCPCHHDRKTSLSIKFRNDQAPLIHCFAGCEFELLRQEFIAMNAWPDSSQKTFVKRNTFEDVWNNSQKITEDSTAFKYLKKRGGEIKEFHLYSDLRSNENLFHQDNNKNQTNKPALIGAIRKDGQLIGIQRIYIGDELEKIKPPKVMGTFKGGYTEIGGKANGEIHLAEGIETALAIHLALSTPVWAAINAENICDVTPDKTVETIHIWADKDRSGTGENAAQKAASLFKSLGFKCFVHVPEEEIEVGKKSIDYLDIFNLNPELIRDQYQLSLSKENKIIPIKVPDYNLPPLTDAYLPFVLREWVFQHAERLNVAPEMVAVPALSIIGAMIGRKVIIRPKKLDQWEEYANLWGAVIAPPGAKKTPAMKLAIKHLAQIQNEITNETARANNDNSIELAVCESDIKFLKKQLKEASEKDESPEAKKEISRKINDLENKKKKLIISPLRLFTSDSTIEKMIEILSNNPNGLMILRDELSGILNSFEKSGHETDRAFYLEGWNGNQTHVRDTIKHGEQIIPGLCLTILGGTQPAIINKILLKMKHGIEHDGFVQRFQLLSFTNQNITPGFRDISVPKEVEEKVYNLLSEIVKMKRDQHGILNDQNHEQTVAMLDDEAYSLFVKYMNDLELEVHKTKDSPYKNHISKFPKLLSGLILIFHIIDNIETQRTNHLAQEHIVEMAIRWTELQKQHAKKLYDTEYSFQSICGFALAEKIVASKIKNNDSLRSIYRNEWTHLTDAKQVEAAAYFLEKHRWIEIYEKPSMEKVGRTSTCIRFNPELQDFLKTDSWYSGVKPLDSES